MMYETLVEEERGCGHRHDGEDGVGIYLVGGVIPVPCERLPFPLGVCGCCYHDWGKHFRGYKWINPAHLFSPDNEPICCGSEAVDDSHHARCAMCSPLDVAGERALLMWAGADHYPDPADFLGEAFLMGVSKRIRAVPDGFIPGHHWVYIAHTRAIPGDVGETGPGIITAFCPERIELVINNPDHDDPSGVIGVPEKALALKERYGDACRIVRVVKAKPEDE